MTVTAQPGAATRRSTRQRSGRWATIRATVEAWRDSAQQVLDKPLTPYFLLLGSTGLLLAIGLIMVLSASSVDAYRDFDNSYYWAIKQLVWVVAAIPCAVIATRLPLGLIRAASWLGLVVALAMLAAVHYTSLGVEVAGNKNWLALGPVQVQPSEFAKFVLVIWCADVFARKEHLLHTWRHVVVPVIPVALSVIALVLLGQDLGTALVMFAIVLGLLWVVGVPSRVFLIAMSVSGAAALFLAATSEERLERITTFMNPFGDFHGSGWQAGHGILGMASGGVFGKGIGASQQKWGGLPEAHTDFIFAVLGEELGLVGTLLVLVLFFTLFYAAIRVARETDDPFVRYATSGIVLWLMAHVIINIGMVLALLPVIGIPLPLVSYGGSSLVFVLVALGLLMSFARREPGAAAELRKRRRARRAVNAVGAPWRRKS